ncbi:MAG: glycosyltransferase family 4 protein [Balneolales bacterium]
MKISYILTEHIDPDGHTGASAHVRENIRNLRSMHHEVTLISPANGNTNGTFSQPDPKKWNLKSMVPARLKREALRYRDRKQQRELVEKSMDRLMSSDIIYERDAFRSFAIYNLREKIRKPWIIECNGFFWGDLIADFHKPVLQQRYKRLHLKKWMAADHLIAVSSRFKQKMVSDGIPADKISVIHNGVDLHAHERVDQQQVNRIRTSLDLDKHIVVGFVGSILPWHRLDLFLTAISKLKGHYPVKGLVVGGGIWQAYRKQANDLGLDKVVSFTGPVDPGKVPSMIAAMDICCLPGSTDYNSPVKLFDYGAAHKPVIAADFQAVSEIISDHETGLLFEKGNLAGFTNKLQILLGDDRLRRVLGDNLHALVANNHSWEKVTERTNTIINRIIDERKQLR